MSDKETSKFASWTDVEILKMIDAYLAVARTEQLSDLALVAERKAHILIDYLHERTLAKDKRNE